MVSGLRIKCFSWAHLDSKSWSELFGSPISGGENIWPSSRVTRFSFLAVLWIVSLMLFWDWFVEAWFILRITLLLPVFEFKAISSKPASLSRRVIIMKNSWKLILSPRDEQQRRIFLMSSIPSGMPRSSTTLAKFCIYMNPDSFSSKSLKIVLTYCLVLRMLRDFVISLMNVS